MIKKSIIVILILITALMSSLVSPAVGIADEPDDFPSVSGLEREDFFRTARFGFDDPQNNYAFSMARFKGDIYVGTNHNFICQLFQALQDAGAFPPEYEFTTFTCPDGESWSEERAEDMCAEIWRYRDETWERVYRSEPVFIPGYYGLPGLPPEGGWAAKEPGFRNMITFTDKWGETACYAASGVSIIPGRLLLKSTDGINWEPVVTPFEMGSDSRSMAVHNGRLYVGPNIYEENASVWTTDDPSTTGDGSNWQKVADFTFEGPGTNAAVVSMESLHGYLYVGTQNDETGFEVWRSNAKSPAHPSMGNWTQIIEYGAGDMANTRALSMEVFKNKLYVGSSMFPLSGEEPYILPPKGFEVFRINADDSWEMLVGDFYAWNPPPGDGSLRIPLSGWPGGFANIFNLYCWSLQSHGNVLYLGSFDIGSFFQFLPVEELIEMPEFEDFVEAVEDNKEDILFGLEEAIAELEEAGLDDTFIEPLRQLAELLDEETIDWLAVWELITDWYVGADLWKTQDGIVWQPITLSGFENPGNYGFRTMETGSLFVGTANPFEGCEVWQTPEEPVGGEASPVNKTSVLIPWIIAVILGAAAAGYFIQRKRRLRS